ncbi:hypothetical protein CBER1_11168 [Cercospora berteroae]|uniref:Uncharacterized protein n=1 Tax=Cercospora berteroae TaxID=357750 RepID=A0A2S6CEG4_9PEZI|nr:hypothetical protein CBER1_11168 [Cercospora berteroae]
MKLTPGTLVVAAAVLQGSLVAVADDYVVRTYTTEEPSVIEYTTAYETPCTTELEYPEPPKYETETVTETYTEPGKTIKKYKTVTKTKTLQAETRTVTSTYNTTTTEVYKKTIYKPVTYTATATVTNNVTNTVISRTTDFDTVISTSTIVSEVTTTVNGTPIVVPTAIFITQDAPPASTIVSEVTATEDGETFVRSTTIFITQSADTVTQIPDPVTLPASTIITTIVRSGTTITTVITQAPSVVVQTSLVTQPAPPPQIIDGPAPPAQTVTITVAAPPETITLPPPTPECSQTGLVPVSDSAGCGGRNCQIEFEEEAAVHWSDYPLLEAPPLRTAITFINTERRQTCITTSCDSELFTRSYSSSQVSCLRQPCPSNSLNHECEIVVGPLVLPDHSTTSVTQIGSSGWNLRLGPTATANDVGLCGGGVPQCVTATSRALETPLIYIGDVIAQNDSNAVPTAYLLPQIGEYFPPGDPFGACETATLNSVAGYGVQSMLRKRQNRGAPNAKLDLWKGAPDFVPQQVFTVGDAQSAVLPSTDAPVNAPAEPTSTDPGVSQSAPSAAPSTPPDNAQPQPTPTPAPTPSPSQPSGGDNSQPAPDAAPSGSDESTAALPPSFTEPGDMTENISGTMVVTDTVYYSMVPPPNQQLLQNSLAALRTEDIGTLPSESLAAIISTLVNLGGTTTAPVALDPTGSGNSTNSSDDSNSTSSGNGTVTVTQTGAVKGFAERRTSALGLWLVVVALLFTIA